MLGFLGKWASSKGMTRVPNIEGLLRNDARNAILNSGLNVGNEIPLSNAQGATSQNNGRAKGRQDVNQLIGYESFLDFEYYNFIATPYSFTPTTYSFTPTTYSFTPTAYSFTPTTYSFTPVPQRQCCEGGCIGEDIVEIFESEEFCTEISQCIECQYYGGLSCTKFLIAQYCNGGLEIVGSINGPNHTGPIRDSSLDSSCGCGTYSFTPYSFTPYSFTPAGCSPNQGQDCFGPDGCPGQIGCDGLCECIPPSYSFTPYSFTPMAYSFTPYSFTPAGCVPNQGQDCFGENGCPGQINCNGLCDCGPSVYSFTPYSFTPTTYSFTPTAYSFTPYSFTPMAYSFTPYSFTPTAYSFTPYSFTPMAYSFTPYSFTPFTFTPGFIV